MSMTNVDSWAVDLANVGPIYPWVGFEGIMFIVSLALWIGWHIWQVKFETNTYNDEIQKHATAENLKNQAAGETYLHH